MKNKIAVKLMLYFFIILLLFSVVISSVFIALFKNHTVEVYKNDMEKRAVAISETLSKYISTSGNVGMGGRQAGQAMYLRFLGDIAMTDVWIVDEDLNLITLKQVNNAQYNFADLPDDAGIVVAEAFKGKSTFSEGFSDLLSTPTLTVGAPIKSEGKVIGVLLLHSPVEGMTKATTQGYGILAISLIAALLMSILLAFVFTASFTKPLNKMKVSALELAEGNYAAKTGVIQKDEIGELAAIIDVLSERLDEASHESEKLELMRRDFVANISHELRTPITVIRGSLEALNDGIVTEPEQVKSYYNQMLNESKLLQNLVSDLLDLSRLQNADFKMEMQQVNLPDVISEVIRSAQTLAGGKQIEILQETDTQIFPVSGDYSRLRQMIFIFLDNAIKFSPIGGSVTVSLKDRTLSVIDHGTGISEEDMPYIFDRFYKVRSEENKNGTGLGLAIAKQIASRHNIKISVSSEINKGSIFSFEF